MISRGHNPQSLERKCEAKICYEDAYNLVAITYWPSRHIVLRVASNLIAFLNITSEYYDAEGYARICYECLTRPVNSESEEIAEAAVLLASVSFHLCQQQGIKEGEDIAEAEFLARKSLCILQRINGPADNVHFANAIGTLADILQWIGNQDNEVQGYL